MPKGYILAEVQVTDPALFETYRPLAAASIAAFGGKYLVRGGATETLEGERKTARMVLLEFPSPERAMEDGRLAVQRYIDRVCTRTHSGRPQTRRPCLNCWHSGVSIDPFRTMHDRVPLKNAHAG